MSAAKIIGIILIVAGVVGLVYQQFSFTKETHQAKIGPLELSVKEKETVSVPLWISIGAIGIGVVLLVTGGPKSK
jgi:drug/metabolite transporter (DMT)-like permease